MTTTVLVVDDLEANLKLLEIKLLGEYYTVITTFPFLCPLSTYL